jgi:protein-L-isoaspartate(D-aspartate) O-methyltransferase
VHAFPPGPDAERMVRFQVAARGVRDPRVLEAMRRVPRDRFVPAAHQAEAWADRPLPIGRGQTVSQPYMVALMCEALGLRGRERVLEVGTGSGYQAAVLGELAAEVLTVERIPELAEQAARALEALGCANVTVVTGDGCRGLPDSAPFDAIVVAAAAPAVPAALRAQLADGGILVVPVGGTAAVQVLTLVRRREDRYTVEEGVACRFVPLIGEGAFAEQARAAPGRG